MRISDWSSDVCSSDLRNLRLDRKNDGLPFARRKRGIEPAARRLREGQKRRARRGFDDGDRRGIEAGRYPAAHHCEAHATATEQQNRSIGHNSSLRPLSWREIVLLRLKMQDRNDQLIVGSTSLALSR